MTEIWGYMFNNQVARRKKKIGGGRCWFVYIIDFSQCELTPARRSLGQLAGFGKTCSSENQIRPSQDCPSIFRERKRHQTFSQDPIQEKSWFNFQLNLVPFSWIWLNIAPKWTKTYSRPKAKSDLPFSTDSCHFYSLFSAASALWSPFASYKRGLFWMRAD